MAQDRGPDVKFPPPVLFAAGLLSGVVLDRYGRVPSPLPANAAMHVAGIVLCALGMALVYAGIITFRRAKTAIYPDRPAALLVRRGVYAYTRNPMYVGMIVFYVGGALLLHSLGAFALLPVVVRVLYVHVVAREEQYLRTAFPEAYASYCRDVRRWI